MTLLNIHLTTPNADGTLTPAKGVIRFAPTQRRTDAATVVLPTPFTHPLVAGYAAVELQPTTPDWVWRIDEHIPGAPGRTIYAAIPNQETVAYPDLVPLDPATLTPAEPPTAAWTAALAETEARLEAGQLTPDPDDPGFFLLGAL